MHEPRSVGAVGLLAEYAEPGPRGSEGGEDLRPRERETPFDGFRCGQRVPQHEIVARFAVAEREQLAVLGIPKHPVETRVAAIVKDPRDTHPDVVHVDAESRGRSVRSEQPLVTGGLEKRARGEVTGGSQVVEIFGEERVVAVVPGGPRADSVEHLGGQCHGFRLCPSTSRAASHVDRVSPTSLEAVMRRTTALLPLLVVTALALVGCGPTPPPPIDTPPDPRPTVPATATPVPLPSPTVTLPPETLPPLESTTKILLTTEVVYFCDDVACGFDGFYFEGPSDDAIANLTAVFGFEPTVEKLRRRCRQQIMGLHLGRFPAVLLDRRRRASAPGRAGHGPEYPGCRCRDRAQHPGRYADVGGLRTRRTHLRR